MARTSSSASQWRPLRTATRRARGWSRAPPTGWNTLVFSHNGLYAIATTPWRCPRPTRMERATVYLLTDGAPPQLITSGTTVASYTPVAVSDSGQRVLYENERAGEFVEYNRRVLGRPDEPDSPVGIDARRLANRHSRRRTRRRLLRRHEPLVRGDRNAGRRTSTTRERRATSRRARRETRIRRQAPRAARRR